MLHKMETSCILDLTSKDLAYYPLYEHYKNGARFLVLNDKVQILAVDKLKRLYVNASSLESYLNIENQIDYIYYDNIIFYQEDIAYYVRNSNIGFDGDFAIMSFYAYLKDEYIDIPKADIRILDITYLGVIRANYEYADTDEILEQIENKEIFGLFKDDEMIGFIGMHNDGAMGLLRIFENYKHQGYGYLLEAFLINYCLSKKRIPYCQVEDGNEISFKLQDKLKMKKANLKHYWVFKNE